MDCAICPDKIRRTYATLGCAHIFHIHCLIKWRSTHVPYHPTEAQPYRSNLCCPECRYFRPDYVLGELRDGVPVTFGSYQDMEDSLAALEERNLSLETQLVAATAEIRRLGHQLQVQEMVSVGAVESARIAIDRAVDLRRQVEANAARDNLQEAEIGAVAPIPQPPAQVLPEVRPAVDEMDAEDVNLPVFGQYMPNTPLFLTCHICGLNCGSTSGKSHHLLTHDPAFRGYICGVCGRAFTRNWSLQRHQLKTTHSMTFEG